MCCKQNSHLPLLYCMAQVFDDWKAASDAWFAQHRGSGRLRAGRAAGEEGGPPKLPKLSNVTLAFLEACCR